MAVPYVSPRRLVQNSLSAMLSAIEVYNKPQITYRDEVTVILVVNAWELALKAALRQANVRIFYKKERGQPYRSLSLEDVLKRAINIKVFPHGLDGTALTANLQALIEYRNRAIHMYNTPGLGELIYPFLQQNVLNYRDFILARFHKDLADSITWQLLPLAAKAPNEPIQFMKVDTKSTSVTEVQDFIEGLRRLLDDAQKAGGDLNRIASVYDIHLRSVKAMTSADLVVAVTGDADGKVLIRRTDPNSTHPFNLSELLKKVNAKRTGRVLTTHDHQAICWKEGLRDNPRMAWKHSNGASHVWSGDAVNYLVNLPDSHFDSARAEYREYLREKRKQS